MDTVPLLKDIQRQRPQKTDFREYLVSYESEVNKGS